MTGLSGHFSILREKGEAQMISDINKINDIIKNKTFRMWKYSISHRTLLLRAIDNNRIITDLLFTDVLKIDILTDVHELQLIEIKQYDECHKQHVLTQADKSRHTIISLTVSCCIFESTDYSVLPYFEHCI